MTGMVGSRPGPARKPSALRLVEGTDAKGRSGRTLDQSKEPIVPDGQLVPPYELSEAVQAVWDATVADLRSMKVEASTDAHTVAGYCEAAVLHQRASHELAAADLVVQGAETQVANKLIGIQNTAALRMLRFAQEFGLTPAARTRVEADNSGSGGSSAGANPFAG